jgi:hypothetical protein
MRFADIEEALHEPQPIPRAMAASRYATGGAALIERSEDQVEQRRSGRVQDQDLDLPRRTVSLEEIDAAVTRHYRVDAGLLSAHGRRAGPAKAVAVELAARGCACLELCASLPARRKSCQLCHGRTIRSDHWRRAGKQWFGLAVRSRCERPRARHLGSPLAINEDHGATNVARCRKPTACSHAATR